MIGLLITLLVGFGIAFLSRYNSADIKIAFTDYSFFNIPLYVITVGTYLLGILLAWIIEIPQSVATSLHIFGLGRTIKSGNNSITALQNRINKLEIENTRLHESNQNSYRPNIFQNFFKKINQR